MTENKITERIMGAAIEVHRHRGPGLWDSICEACLCSELNQIGLCFQPQVLLPVSASDGEPL
jgi:GxxExxY protein